MEKLSPIETKVRALVKAFFEDEITPEEFKRELDGEKARQRPKQRKLPKARGKPYS